MEAPFLNDAIPCLYRGAYVLQTGNMAHLWAFHRRCLPDWWHSLAHLPLSALSPDLCIWSLWLGAGITHYLSCGNSLWALSPLFGIPMGKSIREKHAHVRTHSPISSRSHRVDARGHVNLPLPPLWKDLSPRGLSCLVGQRGKRLCKRAKWGTGLVLHTCTHISILCEVWRLRKSGV